MLYLLRFWYLSESPVLKPNRGRVLLTIEWVPWGTVGLGKRVCWPIVQSHPICPIRIAGEGSCGHRGLPSTYLQGHTVIYPCESITGIAFGVLRRRHLCVQSAFRIRLGMGRNQRLVGPRADRNGGRRHNQASWGRKISPYQWHQWGWRGSVCGATQAN